MNALTTTEEPYDHEGALKYTIAVVLIFGIGVIGMLGIYARRKVSEDLLDKETNEFFKRFEAQRCRLRRLQRKTVAQKQSLMACF
nr:hypothetical protein BaRGS_034167 [Batillaria attramentaria]